MKIVMVGQGAFGQKHLDGLKKIDGVEVVSLAGGRPDSVEAVAKKYGIPHWTSDLDEALAQPGVEAAILTSPTQMHASQAVQVMRAGKHVEIEIPIADTLADARQIDAVQKLSSKINTSFKSNSEYTIEEENYGTFGITLSFAFSPSQLIE